MASDDSSTDRVPASIPSVPSNDQLPSHSLSIPSVPASAVLRKTRPSSLSYRKRNLPTSHDDMKVMINLQNRQLQVERELLCIEKKKLQAPQGKGNVQGWIKQVVRCSVDDDD